MRKILVVFLLLVCSFCYADWYVVTANSLNVREKPNSQGTVVAKVKKGQKIDVVSFSLDNQWANVKVNGRYGWASAKYIKPTEAPKQVSREEETPAKVPFGMTLLIWLVYAGAICGVVCFFLFLVKAVKRFKIFSHIIVFGGSTVLLISLAFSPNSNTAIIVMSPLLLMNVFTWPFLYARDKKLAEMMSALFMVILIIVVMCAMKVNINSWFFRLLLSIGLIALESGIWLSFLGAGKQLNSICPYCGMYADHRKTETEYVGSEYSTSEETDEHYDHSETSGNTITHYYVREHKTNHYEHQNYDDWYKCCKCHREFPIRRIEVIKIG